MTPNSAPSSPSDVAFGDGWRWVVAGLLVGVWTIPGLLCAGQIYAEAVVRDGQPFSVASILWYAMPIWWAWIPLTLGVAWLSRRFPLAGERRWANTALHVAGCIAAVLVHLYLYAAWIDVAAPYETGDASVFSLFVGLLDDAWVHVNLFIYALIVGSVHAFDYYRASKQQEIRESQLRAQLKASQLDTLRAQLRPHFLFNTLSAIQTLTLRNDDPQSAQMIARLSEFLRTTLNETDAHCVSLAEELRFVDQYVSIEKCRFEDRLTVDVDVPPDVRGAQVPTLMLQPLVENAIRHGIEPKEAPGRVEVRARKNASDLVVQVRDDGVGGTIPSGSGEGLSNTRARLQELYGSAHSLTVDTAPGDGFCVTLRIPYSESPVADRAEGDGVPSGEMRLTS